MAMPWEEDEIVKPSGSSAVASMPWEQDEVIKPSAGATRSFDAPVTEQQYEAGGAFASAFPRTFESQMQDKGAVQQGTSAAADVYSLPGRAIASFPAFLGALQGGASLDEAMGEFGRQMRVKNTDMEGAGGFAEEVVRDPATLVTAPLGAGKVVGAGAKALAKVGATAIKGATEGAVSTAVHQTDRYGQTGKVDFKEAGLETIASGFLPAAATGAGMTARAATKNAVPVIKNSLSWFANVPEDVLNRAAKPGELQKIAKATVEAAGDPDKLSGDVIELVGRVRQKAQAELDAVEGRLTTATEGAEKFYDETAGQTIVGQSKRPISNPADISGSETGQRIQQTAQGAKQEIGARFGRVQDEVLNKYGAGGSPLLPDDSGRHAIGRHVDDVIKETGWEEGTDKTLSYRGQKVTTGMIDKLRELETEISKSATIGDGIIERRGIDKTIATWDEGTKELFKAGSVGDSMLKEVRGRIDQELQDQVTAYGNETLTKLWKTNDAVYKVGRDNLEAVQRGLSMKSGGNVDTYFDKIGKIGVAELRTLKNSLKQNKNLGPVWQELESGFFDNLVAKSMKDGQFDVPTFMRTWNKLDKGLKETMLSKEQIGNIAKAIDTSRKELAEFTEKATARAAKERETVAKTYGKTKPQDIGSEIVGYSLEKEGTANSAMKNLGRDSGPSQAALKQLRFLEDLTGVPDEERLSTKALDVYAGRQLKMDKSGKLPKMATQGTGASLKGIIGGMASGGPVGGSIGLAIGGPIGGIVGSSIGSMAGSLAGFYSQSPHAVVAIYKALNAIEVSAPVKMTKRAAAEVAKASRTKAGRTATSIARQSVRSGMAGPDEREDE